MEKRGKEEKEGEIYERKRKKAYLEELSKSSRAIEIGTVENGALQVDHMTSALRHEHGEEMRRSN